MADSGKSELNFDKPPPYAPSYSAPMPNQQPLYPPVSNQQQPYPPAQSYSANYVSTSSAPPPSSGASPNQIIIVQQSPAGTGNCPVCRRGNLVSEYTCCGIFLAIFFFPIGILCCLLMKQNRCTHCGACH